MYEKRLPNFKEKKQWFFEEIHAFKPEIGFKTQFIIHVETRKFTHLWKITEVIPQKKITYNWKYKEYTGDSVVTYELVEKKDTVQLKLSHIIIEEFPDDIPELSQESGISGWNYFIKNTLKKHLESK